MAKKKTHPYTFHRSETSSVIKVKGDKHCTDLFGAGLDLTVYICKKFY